MKKSKKKVKNEPKIFIEKKTQIKFYLKSQQKHSNKNSKNSLKI